MANGCRDDTAVQAGSVAGVRVIEIGAASKIVALNTGDAVATAFPRAYIDADVAVTADDLRALAGVLSASSEARAAAPRMRVDSSASTWPVRAYYRVWELSDFRGDGHIGSGVYAVNERGRERWGDFPDVIADDRFVQQRFAASERTTLHDATFSVRASRDMSTHVRRGVRIEQGNRELRDDLQRAGQISAPTRYGRLLGRVLVRPGRWLDLPCYVYGFGMAKLRARRRSGAPVVWSRDDSLREEARV